jgi:hypothetical protein
MLEQYISDTQNLLNDAGGQFFPIPTLTRNINRARRRACAASGCLRIMPPNTTTIAGQEVYPFTAWNALVQAEMPGVESILSCRSITVGIGGSWQQNNTGKWSIVGGSWKPMWRHIPWTDFQARFRIYGGTFYGVLSEPGWWAQYGAGPIGKMYLAPIPSMALPMELDLTCIPSSLTSDKDPDPIPYPWTDAVAYWAAVLCLLQQQRGADAKTMAEQFNTELPFAAAVICPQFLQTPYGATLRSA